MSAAFRKWMDRRLIRRFIKQTLTDEQRDRIVEVDVLVSGSEGGCLVDVAIKRGAWVKHTDVAYAFDRVGSDIYLDHRGKVGSVRAEARAGVEVTAMCKKWAGADLSQLKAPELKPVEAREGAPV